MHPLLNLFFLYDAEVEIEPSAKTARIANIEIMALSTILSDCVIILASTNTTCFEGIS
jgi:hypothetical protein